MIEIHGQYNTARCFTDNLEQTAESQIRAVCEHPCFAQAKIRVMRKGAVSAQKGEKLLNPINMRDGGLICVGKGNEDWNCSAPHGAGRLMSRKAAFQTLSMEEYKAQMAGVFSTCIIPDTLDESPMAYKTMDEIVRNIAPTAEIIERITPVYNFKAAE